MIDGSRRIRRIRITSEDNLSEEVQLIPPDSTQSQRIRRTSTSSENLPEKTPLLPSPSTEHSFSEEHNQNSPNLITGIDQIKAELIDDRRFSLVESEYWNETHDWGDEASEEYWHFLGQYE